MSGQRRAAAWCGRVLLLAALLFGIVTMHTLGHPVEHNSSHMPGSSVMAAATGFADHALEPTATHSPQADVPAPLGGMDPMSVCLAVLTVWAIALPAAGALSRQPADLIISALARLSHAAWPIPPPGSRRTLLAQLSVLRL
ncbi:DUF6153 family protein [Streptomyces formicae]|uniref:Uncharacterized protein n=1 Tax=Streptomyces formicae TaxID=1616117 RepID=A0ABY3WI16_9ACTN|nr:DUF6153 family protein [Streptomyces formicae]UNM12239.1 hypothetical protein J4032_12460 [Streptomyces formicae]